MKLLNRINKNLLGFLALVLVIPLLVSCAGQQPTVSETEEETTREHKEEFVETQKPEPVEDQTSETEQAQIITPPNWYKERTYVSDVELIKIGYGKGNTRDEAMNQALNRIARQLGVKVKSVQRQSVKSIKEKEETIKEQFQSQVKISTERRIKNFDNLKTEAINGTYFSAYKVDRRPLEQILAAKLKSKLPEDSPPATIKWEGPEPLVDGSLMDSVENRLVDSSDGSGKSTFRVSLSRANEQWIISVGPVNQPLENPDFARLLAWSHDKNESLSVELMPEKLSRGHNRLHQGDKFYFRVKSKNPGGYHALFNIYSDGRISVLKGATELKEQQFVPNQEKLDEGEIFRANLIEAGKTTFDVYLAVSSAESFSATEFSYLGKALEMVEGESAYRLDRFLQWLEQKNWKDVEAITVQVLPDQTF